MGNCHYDFDIAIVGAGVAGLAAAKYLTRECRNFVVLEASHRIGGRAYTEYLAPGVPFDLGAHWIHSPGINPFFRYAQKANIALSEEREDFLKRADYFEDGVWLPAAAAAECDEYFERQYSALAEAAANGDDALSVFDVVESDSRWAPYFFMFFAQDYTHDVDCVSVKDAMSYIRQGNDHAVTDGFGALIAHYGSELPIRLNCPVSTIDWSGSTVKLQTPRGPVAARRVILTVSTGVLSTNEIEFVPGLPDRKRAAITALPMGDCSRICLALNSHSLANLPADFTVRATGEDPLHFRNRPCGHDYIEIVAGGRLAAWMEKAGERANLDYVENRLQKVFGSRTSIKVRKHIVSAWSGDQWTKGAYSAAVPGSVSVRQAYGESLENRVYFAGEAGSIEHYATVHGAYFTGRDAVLSL